MRSWGRGHVRQTRAQRGTLAPCRTDPAPAGRPGALSRARAVGRGGAGHCGAQGGAGGRGQRPPPLFRAATVLMPLLPFLPPE